MLKITQLLCCILMFSAAAAGSTAYAAETDQQLYANAKKEGSVVWYASSPRTGIAEQLGRAFEARYKGIKAVVVRTTAQTIFQRLTMDMRSNHPIADVFTTSDVGHIVELKRQKMLEQLGTIGFRCRYQVVAVLAEEDAIKVRIFWPSTQ